MPEPDVYSTTLRTIYAAEAQKLHAAFKASSAFDSHNGMKGEAREALLHHGLRQHIPGHVEVIQNAKIINAQGVESRQCDLVVKDRSWPAFLDTGRSALVAAELVYANIEVKSNLNQRSLREA